MSADSQDRWPRPLFTFTCQECGRVVTIEGQVMRQEYERTTPVLVVHRPWPDGWRQVCDKLYCFDHTIVIERKLIVDGVVKSKNEKPWGEVSID